MTFKHFWPTTVGELATIGNFLGDGFTEQLTFTHQRIASIYSPDVKLLISDMENNGWKFDHIVHDWRTVHEGATELADWKLSEMFSPMDGVIGWAISIGGSPGDSFLTTYIMVM